MRLGRKIVVGGSLGAIAIAASSVMLFQRQPAASLDKGPSPSSVINVRERIAIAKQEGIEPDFLQAYDAFLWQRAFPFDSPDWQAYDLAYQVRDAMAPARLGTGPESAVNWIEKGPYNLDTPARIWHGPRRPLSGRINGIAVHPFDEKTVYVATAGGGVWKTTDAGDNWAAKSGSDWPNLQTNTVAVDPKNPSKVYVGTGDARGFFRLYGKGVFRSADGGDTWSMNNNLDGSSVSEIAVHPETGEILAATSGRSNFVWQTGQVYLSNDAITFNAEAGPGTAIWQGVSIGAKGRNGKRDYYVAGYTLPTATTNGAVRVWRRNGQTGAWTNVTPTGLTAITRNNVNRAGVDVSASPANPEQVYVISGLDRQVLKSTNRGGAWTDVSSGKAPWNDAYNWSQSGYNFFITCSYVPGGGRDIVCAGEITVAGSKDQGTSWFDIGKTYAANAATTHNDHHAAAYAPINPLLIYFANDGGLYRISYDLAAEKWGTVIRLMNNKLNTSQFYYGASGPAGDQFLGGTQDNASPRSFGANSPVDNQAPSTNRWNNSGSGDGSFTAINPNSPLDSFVVIGGGLRRSTDGWKAFTIDASGNYIADSATQFAINFPNYGFDGYANRGRGAMDQDGSTVYHPSYNESTWRQANLFRYRGGLKVAGSRFDSALAGVPGNDGLLRFRLGPDAKLYQNSGFTFDSTGAGSDRGWISATAVAPGDRNTVYVGTSTGRVFMTRNARAGVTTVAFVEITRNLPGRFISDIAVDPNDPHTLYVALGGTGNTKDYVWRNTDAAAISGAGNWTDIDNGLPPVCHNTIAIDPASPGSTLYAGSDVGVFRTTNGGAAWTNATAPLGLPNVQVNKLVANYATGTLDAFTFGRGVWSLPLGGAVRVVGYGFHSLITTGNVAALEGRIVLNKPVAANLDIPLGTDAPDVFKVPVKVTIPKDSNSVVFTIQVVAPAAQTSGFIVADVEGTNWIVTLTANP